MGERYTRYSTANDVMKEFLIYGAELTETGFPMLPAVQAHPSDTIDQLKVPDILQDEIDSLKNKVKEIEKRLNIPVENEE